eukprot:scaffold94430_cov19-Prasinocladus_malaysianus.AAC.2
MPLTLTFGNAIIPHVIHHVHMQYNSMSRGVDYYIHIETYIGGLACHTYKNSKFKIYYNVFSLPESANAAMRASYTLAYGSLMALANPGVLS